MKIWTCGSSPRSGSRSAWTRIKNVNGTSRRSNFRNFFGSIQMISCRDWWPWTKLGYITMNRRQSSNQWSGSIATDPIPKIFRVQKSPGKVLASIFVIKTASSSLFIFQKAKLSTPSITHLCWCSLRTFWRRNAAGSSPSGCCSCTTMPRLTGHLQPRRNWPTLSWSPTLFSGSGPVGLPPVLWTEKKQLKVRHFSSDAEVVAAVETWLDGQPSGFFLSGLQNLEQRAKKCIELRGELLNKSRVWSL